MNKPIKVCATSAVVVGLLFAGVSPTFASEPTEVVSSQGNTSQPEDPTSLSNEDTPTLASEETVPLISEPAPSSDETTLIGPSQETVSPVDPNLPIETSLDSSLPSETSALSTTTTKPETKTVTWFMPNSGSPSNVTWPQRILQPGDAGWCQVDKYKYGTAEDTAQVDRLVAAAVLNSANEDSGIGIYISNTFEPCSFSPVVVPAEPILTSSLTCEGRTVVTTTTTGSYNFTLIDNVWVRNAKQTYNEPTSVVRDATEEECPLPVVTPPTTEVITPPAAVTPVVSVVQVQTAPVSAPKAAVLASTGATPDPLLYGGLALLVLGMGGVVLRRKLAVR